MKRKVVSTLAVLLAALMGANFLVSRNAKIALRANIEQNEAAETKGFAYIGEATSSELSHFHGSDYSITILPFDWVERSLSVTHTAFIKTENSELRIRLRLNPWGAPNHIVGYTRIK
jgi:hypothetical protein